MVEMWKFRNSILRTRELPIFGKGITGWSLINIFLVEVFGTGILMYLGCMSVLNNLGVFQICVVFGFTVATILQTFSNIGLAHINPSISVAAVILGKINVPLCIFYIIAECIGATLGYGLLLAITPTSFRVVPNCCSVPAAGLSVMQSLGSEILVTSILIFMLCGVWDSRNTERDTTIPLKFGFAITALALSTSTYNISMNSARSLAPALWHNIWTSHWIYWVGPLSAALLVSTFYKLVFDNECNDVVNEELIPLKETSSGNTGQR